MATLYRTNGTTDVVSPKNGRDFQLEELQGFVGGYIQIVPLDAGRQLVCNEEGKLDGLPFNLYATGLFGKYLLPGDVLVGNILICVEGEIE